MKQFIDQQSPVVEAIWSFLLVGTVLLLGIGFGLMQRDPPHTEYHRHFHVSGSMDFKLNSDNARMVVEQGAYPTNKTYFVYPVPILLLYRALDVTIPEFDGLAWALAQAVGAIVAVTLLVRMLGFERPGVSCFGVFLLCGYYFLWDLACMNCNSINLALVLGSMWAYQNNRQGLAGVLLALSITLKMYSGLILIYFLLRRDRVLVLATLATLVGLFVLLPVLNLGWPQAWFLTWDWWRAVQSASQVAVDRYEQQTLVGISTMLWQWAGRPSPPTTDQMAQWQWLSSILKITWLFLVGVYWVVTLRQPRRQPGSLLQDVGVLLVAPLPLSPIFQPHHGAVAVVLVAVGLRNLEIGVLPGVVPWIVWLACGFWGVAVVIEQVLPSNTPFVPAWYYQGHLLVLMLMALALSRRYPAASRDTSFKSCPMNNALVAK